MANDVFDERRRALEDQYFERENRVALERLQKRGSGVRKSPITGEPMEAVTMMGVVVDRCPTSGGIYLDAGELEMLLKAAVEKNEAHQEPQFLKFVKDLFGTKKT
jgi:Zn-finger nucleic acid-binding protein